MSDEIGPKRIQLSRAKGYRKPEGAVVVARPSRWGNPFRVGQTFRMGTCPADCGQVPYPELRVRGGEPVRDRTHAVELFATHIAHNTARWKPDDIRRELAGRDLACWCPLDQPCHADVLLEIANA